MSTTIISVIVILSTQLLPLIGVTVENEQLTTTIQTLFTVGAGVWIWVQRVKLGGVNKLGMRTGK